MEDAILGCPQSWAALLPEKTRRLERPEELGEKVWRILALTRRGCNLLGQAWCEILLVHGDCAEEALGRIRARTVITCGLSHRDSLTLSSLTEPVLCVQRTLPRPGGGEVVPQEFPLPPLPTAAEELLPLLGLRLLQMPQTNPPFF